MSDQHDVVHVVRQWVEKAEHDLRNAEHTLLMGDDCPYDTVCFHAQQCAEKYVKALLALRSVDFPKIHDLGELIELLPAAIRPPVSVEEQEQLTDHATVDRYPGDRPPLGRADAHAAVAVARRVREAIRALLPQEALR